jgi:hypothetical protein
MLSQWAKTVVMFFVLKEANREEEKVFYNMRFICVLIWSFLSMISLLTYDNLEGMTAALSIAPLLQVPFDNWIDKKLKFFKVDILLLKPLMLYVLCSMMTSGRPYSLLPPQVSSGYFLWKTGVILVGVIAAQWLWRPRLCFKEKEQRAMINLKIPELKKFRDLKDEHDGLICSICLVRFVGEDEDVAVTNCEHYYHEDCLRRWLELKETCPDCGEVCLKMREDGSRIELMEVD